jgi:uncharacterized protein (TIGR03437 family)
LAVPTLFGQIALNRAPSRVVGHSQNRIVTTSPNLPESHDLFNPTAVAVDATANPPILYVADAGNNRVLAWRSVATFTNGAPADLVVGQRDFITTLAYGPGTELSTGFNTPTAVAVDSRGNLYIADSGNNRILRYPRPTFQSPDELSLPNLVIGQPNFSQNRPNNSGNNTSAVSPKGLALNTGFGRIFRTSMVFDASGNLWVADSGNNRVVRYSANALQTGQSHPDADQVLGQLSLTAIAQNVNQDAGSRNSLFAPSGLAIDSNGRLYICDAAGRVVVYTRPVTGSSADRIMGLRVQNNQRILEVNETTLGRIVGSQMAPPEGVFIAGGKPYVIDTAANRILRYDAFENWPGQDTAFSPPARAVFGQPDFASFRTNRGLGESSAAGFDSPVAAVVHNSEAFVVDSGNNRVLVMPLVSENLQPATRLLGQSAFFQSAPNNIDGREMFLFGGLTPVNVAQANDGAALAIDTRSTPPRLYIADTYNNRILAFRDARNVKPGDRADLVIGQRDFSRSLINNPANDPNQMTENGLFVPVGLAVDAGGNLYVADSGNGRVLRYPSPFDQEGQIRPDLVLGQASFFLKVTDATSRTMSRPHAVALTVDGHLVVSDAAHNRILFFRKPEGGDFSNGQAAEKVFGQPNFSTINPGTTQNRVFSPRGIALDTDDRLYVCDLGNNRILIYDRVTTADTDAFPALNIPGLNSPHSIFVSPNTGEIWIAETQANRALRLPRFIDILLTGDIRSNYVVEGTRPLAVALDASGALYMADATNRVAIFFPGLGVANAGHLLPRVSPGARAQLRPVDGASFGEATVDYKEVGETAPTELGDIQVTVDGIPAPILSVAPREMKIILPQGTPEQNVEFLVTRVSSGQILGATEFTVSRVAPALLTVNPDGNGQVMAKNPDGTDNSAIDRVGRSETISLFATGFGATDNAPPDGEPAAEQAAISGELRVLMGTDFVASEDVTYVGYAPGMIGVVQIDIKVPDRVAPEPNIPVVLLLNSVPSNLVNGVRRVTTIAVKP